MENLKALKEIIIQTRQARTALNGLCSESIKFSVYFLQCFGVFFTLIYAVRQLGKELHSS